ncbi:MAG: hypothetical protein AAB853_00550 [Patescibacteria group bacterium]
MAYQFVLTRKAERDLQKLGSRLRLLIEKKLRQFLSAENPLVFAEPLVNLPPATHRFRVGKIRITFFCQAHVFTITSIEPRDKVYRR